MGTAAPVTRKYRPHAIPRLRAPQGAKSKRQREGSKRAEQLARPVAIGATRVESLDMLSPLAGKPNVGRVGSAPPPASKDRLRALSKVGDIAIGHRVVLPVPLPEPQIPPCASSEEIARLSSREQAAEKYVIEREQKRRIGFDIPKHSRYNFGKEIAAGFGGIRQIDGQTLVLLKVNDEILVMPVDESTARRLRRIPLGQQIAVQAHGAIKTKGRSR
jgi:hypothetical protein